MCQDLAQAIGERPSDPEWRVQVLPCVEGVHCALDATGSQQDLSDLPARRSRAAPKRKENVWISEVSAASVEALV